MEMKDVGDDCTLKVHLLFCKNKNKSSYLTIYMFLYSDENIHNRAWAACTLLMIIDLFTDKF